MAERVRKTALILSAGGGFGAYQAGAWSVLEPLLKPDAVIGASVGSLNGWAIAGRMPAEELCEFWRSLDINSHLKMRWALPRNGFLSGAILERVTREIFDRYPAQIEYGAVTTEWRGLHPRLFRAADMTWRHLYASCAIPLVFQQQLLGGRLHADGGLLGALPLWAASEFGATHVVAIDIWKVGLARLQRFLPRRKAPADVEVTLLTPSQPLGSALDSLFWNRRQVDEWMALGASDARALVASGRIRENISVGECFERQ